MTHPSDVAADRRFVAFISYSHADRRVARWLHRAIEGYRFPSRLRAQAEGRAPRLSPVFLDREELPSSTDLVESVRLALEQSECLIVVCSPAAARSKWVNEEVRRFKVLGRGARIICLLVAGEPRAADKGSPAEEECLPPALRFHVQDGELTQVPAPEPLAADLRPGGDGRRDAKLKIIAGLIGTGLDDLRQRDQARRQRRLVAVGAAAVIGCVVFAGLAVAALLARNEAERQRRIAEQKSLTAERTAAFMVSLFRVSDPSEARGNTITAREILDRGARQIDMSLRDEPQVRAELSTTLGEVYTGLGLYNSAFRLLSKARQVPEQAADAQLRQAISLAELEFQRGNDARADELLRTAEGLAAQPGVNAGPALRARLLLDRGDVAAFLERDDQARQHFEAALRVGEAHNLGEVTPRALEGLGLAAFYGGDMIRAKQWYEKALAARIQESGESHPKVSETLTALGSIAYMEGDSQRAEEHWLRSLSVDRRVLGTRHADLAVTMNNLGRLRLERREFERAIAILREAVSLYDAEQSEAHEGRVFAETNLALAHMGLRDSAAAEPLFRRALRTAVVTRHRLEGPILTDLADLECRTNRWDAGLARLAEARPVVAERYPDEAWRVAHVDNVRAGCLTGLKRVTEAEALITNSMPALLEKWPEDTYYGHDALERATRVYRLTGNSAKLAELGRLPDHP